MAGPMWNGGTAPSQTKVSLTNPPANAYKPAPTSGLVIGGLTQQPTANTKPKQTGYRHVAVTPRGVGVHHHPDMPKLDTPKTSGTPINLANQPTFQPGQ